jgi:hypothetical protein
MCTSVSFFSISHFRTVSLLPSRLCSHERCPRERENTIETKTPNLPLLGSFFVVFFSTFQINCTLEWLFKRNRVLQRSLPWRTISNRLHTGWVPRQILFSYTTTQHNKVNQSFNDTFLRHSNMCLPSLFTLNTDAFELARQANFELDIPEESARPTTKFRIGRKSFAIACHTTMSSENQFMNSMNTECYCSLWSAIEKRILEHIQDVFYKRIQYVCISSPCNPLSSPRVVYIQIILNKVMNKIVYFMERVAGLFDDCVHHKVSNGISFIATHCRNAMQLPSDVWWSLMESILEKRFTCQVSTKMGTYFVHFYVSSRSLPWSWRILLGQIASRLYIE